MKIKLYRSLLFTSIVFAVASTQSMNKKTNKAVKIENEIESNFKHVIDNFESLNFLNYYSAYFSIKNQIICLSNIPSVSENKINKLKEKLNSIIKNQSTKYLYEIISKITKDTKNYMELIDESIKQKKITSFNFDEIQKKWKKIKMTINLSRPPLIKNLKDERRFFVNTIKLIYLQIQNHLDLMFTRSKNTKFAELIKALNGPIKKIIKSKTIKEVDNQILKNAKSIIEKEKYNNSSYVLAKDLVKKWIKQIGDRKKDILINEISMNAYDDTMELGNKILKFKQQKFNKKLTKKIALKKLKEKVRDFDIVQVHKQNFKTKDGKKNPKIEKVKDNIEVFKTFYLNVLNI